MWPPNKSKQTPLQWNLRDWGPRPRWAQPRFFHGHLWQQKQPITRIQIWRRRVSSRREISAHMDPPLSRAANPPIMGAESLGIFPDLCCPGHHLCTSPSAPATESSANIPAAPDEVGNLTLSCQCNPHVMSAGDKGLRRRLHGGHHWKGPCPVAMTRSSVSGVCTWRRVYMVRWSLSVRGAQGAVLSPWSSGRRIPQYRSGIRLDWPHGCPFSCWKGSPTGSPSTPAGMELLSASPSHAVILEDPQ